MVRIDMDMPAKCIECMFAAHDVFGFTGACNAVRDSSRIIGFDSANRPGWCPLHEIVSCGDLINANDGRKCAIYKDVFFR